jgi:hypothetical protein
MTSPSTAMMITSQSQIGSPKPRPVVAGAGVDAGVGAAVAGC